MSIAGTDVLVEPEPHPTMWGCFVMVPFAGRIGHARFRFPEPDGLQYRLPTNLGAHAIHGYGFESEWDVEPDGSLTLPLGEPWPFRGSIRQRFDAGPHWFTCHVEVLALDTMPITVGWHPWFRRPVELRFRPRRMYTKGLEQLPTGELTSPSNRPWDDCFVDPPADPVVVFPSGLALTLSSTCDHWVVYDAPGGLCVEPQSGPPDAVNLNRAVVLEAGHTLHHSMTWSWAMPPAR